MYSYSERVFVPALVAAVLIVMFGYFFWQAGLPWADVWENISQSCIWAFFVCVTFLVPTHNSFKLSKVFFGAAVVYVCWTDAFERLHERYSWVISPISYLPQEPFRYPDIPENITEFLANSFFQIAVAVFLIGLSFYAWRLEYRR